MNQYGDEPVKHDTGNKELDAILDKASADMRKRTLFNWAYRRMVRTERCLVDRDVAWVKHIAVVRTLLTALVFGVSMTIAIVTSPYLVTVPLIVVTTLLIMRGAMADDRVARAYRTGWLAGRSEMMSAYDEAQVRGLSDRAWAQATYERDVSVFW